MATVNTVNTVNTITSVPCGKCANFDAVIGPNHKITAHGWCAKQSKYPHTDPPTHPAPQGAERVERGELAEPRIVRAVDVFEHCPFVARAVEDPINTKIARAKADVADAAAAAVKRVQR